MRRLKAQVDELTRQNQELQGIKGRLSQDNHNLHHQVQELERANADLAKAKLHLQQQVEDLRNRLDEETRVCCLACNTTSSLSENLFEAYNINYSFKTNDLEIYIALKVIISEKKCFFINKHGIK